MCVLNNQSGVILSLFLNHIQFILILDNHKFAEMSGSGSGFIFLSFFPRPIWS